MAPTGRHLGSGSDPPTGSDRAQGSPHFCSNSSVDDFFCIVDDFGDLNFNNSFDNGNGSFCGVKINVSDSFISDNIDDGSEGDDGGNGGRRR